MLACFLLYTSQNDDILTTTDWKNVSIIRTVLSLNRVLAPPGGKSSISFTDVCEPAPPVQRDVNACQAARNRSNVFASEPAPEPSNQMKACQQQRQMSSVFGETNQPAPIPRPKEPEPPRKPHIVNPHQEARQKSQLFTEKPATDSGDKVQAVNPHQEARQKSQLFEEVPTSEQSKTSVHISAPPGGVSNITFG